MNPLLSPYVRGPSPFDSMDLSVQSTRSSSSPLSKGGVGSSQHPVLPHDYGHKQQQQQQQPPQHPHANQLQHQQQPHSQQTQMHAPNNYTAHLPATSPHSLGHSQSHQHQQQQPPSHQAQQQQKQRQPHLQLQPHAANINPHIMQQSGGGSSSGTPSSSSSSAANTKYLNSNGGDCDMLPPSLVVAGSGSGGVVGGGGSTSTSNISSNPNSSSGVASTDSSTALYMREIEPAAHMPESYTKISTINRNYENELQSKVSHKPVELVNKDCNFTMSSNKMSHPQQVSPKKHSPLRNYHHPPQQPQQQQQQRTHYSSPHTISHNGPHTPPTPQSPVSQQQQQQQPQTSSSISTSNLTTPTTTTMQQLAESRIQQSTGNLLDYNQLHLQHNNSYQPPQHAAAAVTAHPHQQQMPSTPQHPSPHHHHNQQQQQKQQQQPTHHLHFVTHRQQQQQSQLQPQQHQSPQLQHQQQIHHHHHHSHHQHPHLHHQVLPTAPASTSQSNVMTNFDSFTSQSNSKMKELDMATKTAMTDLSATASLPRPAAAAAMAAHLRAQASTASGTFAMRNTSPDNIVTSNEDSVDSNSNSSRARRKRKPNKLARRSSNDSEVDDENAGSVCLKVVSAAAVAVDAKLKHERRKPSIEPEQREREQTTRCSSSSNKSPKQTLEALERRSPIKVEITSPSSFLEPNRCPQLPAVAHNMPPLPCSAGVDSSVIASTTAPKLLATASSDQSENDKITVENGCNTAVEPVPQTTTTTPRKSDSDTDVETIDKIAEMIAKTGNQEVVNCNSSSSTRSGGGASGACCLSIDSPKTKKQRQALKLRSAEQHNSNSNCSTNSNSYNESLPEDAGAANDNAVLAEELRTVKCEEEKEGPPKEPVQNISLNNVTQASTVIPTTQMAPTTTTMTTKSSLSPPTFIHSCSSSSTSSSSCSNSSRSSCVNKENKIKTALELTTQKSPEEPPKEQDANHHNIIKASEEEADCVDVGGAVTMSPKREVVLKYDHPGVESKTPLTNSCTDSKKELIKSPTKSCFEEVENKLEEMFAGIEDEPPPPTTAEENTSLAASNVSEVANDLSLALELVTNVAPSIKENKVRELSPVPLKLDKTPPTKAAKKSTIPSQFNKLNTVTPPTRITPPRRRLSVLVEPIYLAESTKQNRSAIDDQKPTTSAAAAAAGVTKAPPPKENSSPSPKKQCKTKNIQKGTTSSKSKGSAGAGTVASNCAVTGAGVGGGGRAGKGKVNNRKPQQQQQKKHKGKQQRDSEDEETTHVRESNGGVNIGCGGGGGGANAGNQSTTVIGDARYKSPYILVKTDGSITVINAPTAEDVGAEKQTKVKKAASHHRGYAQNRKNLRGMHSSTLSNKYDADTADMTWICVFCKRGPHRMGLGDLFGPYLVSSECEEYRAAVRAPGALDLDAMMDNKRRRIDMVQWHPRNLPVVPAGISGWQGGASTSKRLGGGYNKKKKKSIDDPAQLIASASATATANTAAAVVVTAATTDVLTVPQTVSNIDTETLELNPIVDSGMCKVSETSYEVWLHEDCAVWAPAVFLVGVRVMGLDAAVWNSTRYQCTICGKTGAIICCLHRDCHAAAHLPCAGETQWNLDESNFKVFCHKHVSNNSSSTITSTSNSKVMNATLTSKTTISSAASASSVLAELLSRPPAKPTSSNLPPRRYS